MELDNLKSAWKALQTQSEPKLQDEQIRKMLQGKANDTVSKIKRSILLEGGFTIVLALFFLFNKNWFYSPFIVPYLAVVMVLCLAWYAFKYSKIRKIDLQKNLKQTLKQIISILDLYLKVYLYGSFLLGVLSAMLPLLWKNVTLESVTATKFILIGLLALVALSVYFLFIKWYIKNLYGNYLHELKEELKELEELEEGKEE